MTRNDRQGTPSTAAPVATFSGVKARHVLPWVAGAGASILILLVVAASGFLLYHQASEEQLEGRRRTLVNLASAASALVDVELHRSFHSPAQETTAAYLGAIARLERLRLSNPDLKYVYTCIQRGDSVYFVLDPTSAGDADGDGVDDKSHIMQAYPDAGPSCRSALASGLPAVDDEPYSDAWGTFISAYAPFFDPSGRQVGVVGVDLEITRYAGELRGMRLAAGYGFGVALFLSILVGAGVGYAMRYRMAVDAVRQRSMRQLGEEKARAEEAFKSKSDFLATMSHEIRTPLNAILGMLDLLLDHPLDPGQAQRARIARTSADHLLSLLNDVLDFSKMEAGHIQLETIPFDVAETCREVVSLLRGQAEEKGLHLAFRGTEGLRSAVIGDPSRFRQVLINLVGNALKFTERGGVDVEAAWMEERISGGVLEVKVSDTGIGIPEDKLALLFRKFSQADASTTRQYGGTGLGLAICKRLSEAMGGSIWVDSRDGEGSTFSFSVPLTWDPNPPVASEPPPELAPTEPLLPSTGSPSLPVLLAEDHPINREVAVQILERLGCTVEIAVNGREALEKVRTRDYALVLMDCRMPELDGYRASRAIRALVGPRGRVPIVALTANAGEEERKLCLEAGMNDFIPKPMRRADLVRVVKGLGREKAPIPIPNSAPSVSRALLESVTETFGEANPTFLSELVKLFLDAAPETLDSLEDALQQGDTARAGRSAHTLKGAGLQMGAARLAGLCGELEEAIETSRGTEEILGQVKAEFENVKRELRELSGTV